jgi:hypothetical protein
MSIDRIGVKSQRLDRRPHEPLPQGRQGRRLDQKQEGRHPALFRAKFTGSTSGWVVVPMTKKQLFHTVHYTIQLPPSELLPAPGAFYETGVSFSIFIV